MCGILPALNSVLSCYNCVRIFLRMSELDDAMPSLTPIITQSSSSSSPSSFLIHEWCSELSDSFLLRPTLSQHRPAVKEPSECDTDDGMSETAVGVEDWWLFSLLLAAGEKPREVIDSAWLIGDLCGVEPREDGLLCAGEWLGVDRREREDAAAEEGRSSAEPNSGESRRRPNPQDAALSSRCNEHKSL